MAAGQRVTEPAPFWPRPGPGEWRAGGVAGRGSCRGDLATQQTEFVAFRVGQHVPADVTLADIGGRGTEIEQPLEFGVLLPVGGVEIELSHLIWSMPTGSPVVSH